MAATVASPRRQPQDNSLDLPLLGEARRGQPTVNLVEWQWILPVIAQSIDRVMSRKEGALLVGLSEPEFSKQVSGAEGKSLNVRKLGALGDRFAVALADEIRESFGLNDPQARIQKAAEMVTQGLALLVSEVKR